MERYESPELTYYGTVVELTEGSGPDEPEQAGSTFAISDERLKRDIRPL